MRNLSFKFLLVALSLTLSTSISAQTRTFKVCLSGAQENPPVVTAGIGTATVTVDVATRQVLISGSYTNMSSNQTASHLHGPAPIGSNAGVISSAPGTGGTSGTIAGNFTISVAQLNSLLAGQTYINIHSSNHPGGELRGQVVQEQNAISPAQSGADPVLADNAGDLNFGPKIGDASEPFNLSIDCSGAINPGIYVIQLHTSVMPMPITSKFGFIYSLTPAFETFMGVHTMSVETAEPMGFVLPNNLALAGVEYYAQGFCSNFRVLGRTSNLLRQVIGI